MNKLSLLITLLGLSSIAFSQNITITTPIETDDIVDGTEAPDVTIAGTSTAGASDMTIVRVTIGSVTQDATITGNNGPWTVDLDISGLADGSYSVMAVYDPDGTPVNATNNNYSITLEQADPSVTDVLVSDALLTDSDASSTFTVQVTFDEPMSTGATPTIVFSSDVSSTLTSDGPGSWTIGNTIYTESYTVADGGETDADVTVDVTGAQDAATNAQQDYTPEIEFSVDNQNPNITGVAVSPDGVTANVGDAITVTLTDGGSEAGFDNGSTVEINGVDVSASFMDNTDGTYTYTYTVAEGNADWTSGNLPINIQIQDDALNVTTVTAFTDGNTLVGDANSPNITGVAVSPDGVTANVGDAITVTLTDGGSEAGFDNGSTVEINGVDVSASFMDNTDGTYTYTYTVAEGNADWTSGNLPINIQIQDDALNVTTVTAFTDGNTLAGDANSPNITGVAVSPDGVTANVGDAITVTLTDGGSEAGFDNGSTVEINGVDVSSSFMDNTDGTYTYTYTVAEGNADWTSGNLPINIQIQDDALNVTTVTAFTDGNTLVGDANSPNITGVAVSPDGVTANVGDAITVTLTDGGSEAGFDNGSTVEINGVDVSASFMDNTDGTYTYTYTVAEGNADWTSGNLPINIQIQDDALNVTTVTAFTDGNTLVGDANSPNITGVAVSPDGVTANVGDAITVTLTDGGSEAGFDNGSTVEINGVDVSASFMDNTDGTYTYTYTVAEGNADWTSGNLPINIQIQDDALNVTTVTAFTDGNTLVGDANTPAITADPTVSPDAVTANVGDVISVTLTESSAEAGLLASGTATINGVDVSSNFTDNTDGTYTYTYTIAEGNADWASGSLSIDLGLRDAAGNEISTTTLTSNTLVGDANSPNITGVAVSPDGVTANVGDAITVTLTDGGSEAGFDNGSTVEINGVDVSASFMDNTDGTYTYTYTVAEGNADWTSGNLPINIQIQDDALNVTTVTAFTDGNTLVGDANTPAITADPTVSPDAVTANVGDVISVTLTESSAEAGLLASGTATINGVDVSSNFTDNTDGTYTYTYTIAEGNADWASGSLSIDLGLRDAAGNEINTTTLTSNTLVGDANSPNITGVAVSPDGVTANVGDAITVTLTDGGSEAGFDNGSTVEINGVDVSASFMDNTDGTYTYTYTVAEGNADWTSGNLPINIQIQDDALNVTTVTAFTDGNTLVGDANSPNITGVAVSPDGVTANVGDAITVTLTDGGSEAGFDNGSTVEINGVDVSASFMDNTDGTYTYTYTVAEGNADWTSGNLSINIQIQDDALNVTTVTAFTDGNTLVGDANTPAITADPTVSPDAVTANVGDVISVTLTESSAEAGLLASGTATINGVDVSSNFTDNTDGTYTYTYTIAEGNADWASGSLSIDLGLRDAAGNEISTTTLTSNTLVGDANSPNITGVAVSPDGVTANVGDAITVTLTDGGSEAGFDNGSTVEINGVDVSASFMDNTDGTYTYTYTVAEGNADWTSGNLPINIQIQDDALNVTTVTAFTDGNTLVGDANSPNITGVAVSPDGVTANVGDAITVTLTDGGSEAGFDNGSTVEINGVDVSASFMDNTDGTYTYTYTVAEGNADWTSGNLPINIQIQDDALNVTTVTAFTDGNTLVGDANSPNITGVAVSPDGVTANVGDAITVTLTDGGSEAGFDNGSTVEINGVDVSSSFMDNTDGTYTYTYTVAEGNADWTSGNLPINIQIQDDALNVTTVTAFTDGNTLVGDANSPNITGVAVSPDGVTANVGDAITVTLTDGGSEAGFDNGSTVEINGVDVSASFMDNTDGTYTYTYTVAEGNADWTSGNLPINIQIQDDALNVTTVTAFTDGNTLVGDANTPAITADPTVSPDAVTANVGDVISVTLTESSAEAGLLASGTATINGVDVSSNFTDNTDGTYTYTYTIAEGNADWASGSLSIDLGLRDAAGNEISTTTLTSNTLVGDANSPNITGVAVSPDGVTANVGDAITVTLTDGGSEAGFDNGSTVEINGVDVSASFMDNTDGTYTYTYTVAEGNADWTSGNLPINIQIQDDALNVTTVTAFTDGNTLVGDANSPNITGVAVSPDGVTANVGDAITVTLTDGGSEAGFDNGSTVEINGVDVSASFMDNTDGTYTYTYTVAEGNADWTSGNLPINIQIQDDALNVTTVTAFTDGNTLVGDANSPNITGVAVSPDGVTANVGDAITVTLTDGGSEAGFDNGSTVEINGVDVSASFMDNTDGTYTYTYTVAEGNADWTSGNLPINIQIQDDALNVTTVTAFTDGNTLVGDANSPNITGVAVSPDGVTANVGDAITVTLTDGGSEAGFDNGSTVEINGVDVSASFMDNTDGTYTYTYTVAEGNADWTSGNLPINIQIQDDALNVTTVTAFTDGNTLVGDANSPNITGVAVSPDGVTANVGDAITVTLTDGGSEAGFDNGSTVEINGVDVSASFMDNTDGTYTYTYTVAEGNADWTSGNLPINIQIQDDALNVTTVTAFTDGNTLVGDANSPNITGVAVSPDGVTANVGDAITVTLTDGGSEAGFDNGSTVEINGVDVSASFMDNTDGTYTYTYTVAEGNADWTSGNLPINIQIQDDALNVTTVTAFTDGNTLAGDANSPSVLTVTVDDGLLTDADVSNTFNVEVTFNEAMNTSATPVIQFSATVTGTLALGTGSWSMGNTIYTAPYTVGDGEQEDVDITIDVISAQDAALNPQFDYTPEIEFSIDNENPIVSQGAISITSSGIGTNGEYIIGNTVDAQWDNSGSGDNNADVIASVTIDFSAFEGSATETATNGSDIWQASILLVDGSTDLTNQNISITATDDAGNSTTVTDNQNVSIDIFRPVIDPNNFSITTDGNGAGNVFLENDLVSVEWNDTGTGDNNGDIDAGGVVVNFSEFEGPTNTSATESPADTWTANYTMAAGSTDLTNRNIFITVTDDAGNVSTTVEGDDDESVDNIDPIVTAANITINGANGVGGEFIIGDVVTVDWDNTAGGDNSGGTNGDIEAGDVIVNFGEFEGGDVVATEVATDEWQAMYTIVEGSILNGTTNLNVFLTVNDDAYDTTPGTTNITTTEDDANVTVDNVRPSSPSTPDLIAADDNGSSDTDNISGIAAPTFEGDGAVAGEPVYLYSDQDGRLEDGSVLAAGDQTWSIDLASFGALSTDITHSITATAFDPAGNESDPSGALTFRHVIPPTITSSTWLDSDSDGDVDQIQINFSRSIDLVDNSTAEFQGLVFSGGYTFSNAADQDGTGTSLTLELTPIDGTQDHTGTVSYDATYAEGSIATIAADGAIEMLNGESDDPVDGARPVIVSAITLDALPLGDPDGDVDRVEIRISEPLGNAVIQGEEGNFQITPPADFGTAQTMDASSFDSEVTTLDGGVDANDDDYFSLTYTPATALGTGEFTFRYLGGSGIQDLNMNDLDIPNGTALTDRAAPIVKDVVGDPQDLTPRDDQTDVLSGNTVSLKYSEDVIWDSGNKSITFVQVAPPVFTTYDDASNTSSVDFAATDGTVTITIPYVTNVNTDYYVFIEDGAFIDAENNTSADQFSSATGWNFTTATALVAVSATPDNVNEDDIIITFNDTPDVTAFNAGSFTVSDAFGTFTVTGITDPDDSGADDVTGNDIRLDVNFASALGDLTVAFDPDVPTPSSTVITATAGTLGAFSDLGANTDSEDPVISSATRDNGTTITITYNDAVQVTGVANGDFEVQDGAGRDYPVTNVASGGANTEIVLTVDDGTASGSLTDALGDIEVAYTNNNNGISDYGNNQANTESVTIELDSGSPNIESISEISVTQINVDFDEEIQIVSGSDPDDFIIYDGALNQFPATSMNDGTALDDIIELTVSNLTNALGDLTLEYIRTGSQLSDFGGQNLSNQTGGGANLFIDRDVTSPTVSSAERVNGTTSEIDVTFNEAVQTIASDADDFTIVDEEGRIFVLNTIDDNITQDQVVRITVNGDLDEAVGDIIVTYIDTDGEVVDFGGNNAVGGTVSIDLDFTVAPSVAETGSDLTEDTETNIYYYRSTTDPSANTPIVITPTISGSTITIYRDAALTDDVFGATFTGVTTSVSPTVAQIMNDDISDWLTDGANGVYTFYITETAQNSTVSEGPASVYSLAFLDDIGNSAGGQSFGQGDDVGTTITIIHPTGQDLLWVGDGLSDIDYIEGGTSDAQFIPSAASQGTRQISVRWDSQASGVSATFNPPELLFNVTASSDVLAAATPLDYDKSTGAAIIGINNNLTGIDVGEDVAGDGDDPDKSDFYGIEAYYIVNGAPQTGVGGPDIFGDANSVYNGGSTDANIAADVLTYTGTAFASGQPTDALNAWQFNPSAFVTNIADNGQTVDTVRLVSISQADIGGSRAVIEEVDIYLFPTPQVAIQGVNATYCEDEDQFRIQASILTYDGSGGVDSTGFITNGYILNQSSDGGATYSLRSDSTSSGSAGIVNTIDPSVLGPGLYQIQYTSQPQTDASTISTVTFDFEVINVDAAPSLDITNFDANGGFDGSRYVFEYCAGDVISNLEIDRTVANSVADNTNNNYTWYESDGSIIDDGDANTFELLITSLFNTTTPTNGQEVDLYVTRTLNTCESDSIPITIRVFEVPEIPSLDVTDTDIFQDRDDYYFEYCSDVFTDYDDGTIVTLLADPDGRSFISDRSYFEVLDANKMPIDSIFYNAAVDGTTGYTIDFSAEPYASLVSSTPNASPSGIVTQNFFLVKRVADSAFNTNEAAQQWAGCNGDTAQFITRIYTVPETPAFGDFTGNPHNLAGDGSVVQYYMCRTDDILPLDVGLNVPTGTPNFIYEWYDDALNPIAVTDREGERLSLDDLVGAGFNEDVTVESDYTYYVRLRSNVNEDSGFEGCTTPLNVSSGLREVRIKVLPDVVEPQISLGNAPELNGQRTDVENFDFEFDFCVTAGVGLDPTTEFIADVQYSVTRETEILEWFNSNAAGDAIVGTSIVSTTNEENHTVTAQDLRIQGSQNQTFNFAVLYNTDRVEEGGVVFSGCTSIDTAFVRLNVSTIPDAQFNFSGITAGETTSFDLFDNNASLIDDGGVSFIIRDAGDNIVNNVVLDTLNEAGSPIELDFNTAGNYTATLILTTEAGCSNVELERSFRILEKITVTQSYQEDFETTNGGWFAEFQLFQNGQTTGSIDDPARGSSWEYGNPDGSVIDDTFVSGGNAWATTGTVDDSRPNTYVGGEVSYIYSPAFDLSTLSNPAIEFRTFRDFDGIRDGVVFQYSTDDGVSWEALGDFNPSNVVPSSGQNWYNESGISTAPGEGSVLNPVGGFNQRRVGWADRTNVEEERGWLLSSHALDIDPGVRDLSNVRFRFALSASGTSTDEKSGNGFAFDDINIFQLGKTVIVEQFSSSLDDNSISVNNDITGSNGSANSVLNDLDDVMLLNYFTRLANSDGNLDEINARNRDVSRARTAYYGVGSVPSSAVDGRLLAQTSDDQLSFNENDINVGKLASAGFDFPTIISTSSDPGMVGVRATFRALEDIQNANLSFIFAVVERTVTVPAGGFGNYQEGQTIDNVVRILLPGTDGFNYIGNVSSDASNVQENVFDYSVEWVIDNVYDPSQLRVIVFVQDNTTKEILQSGFIDIDGATESILGLNDEGAFEIYPIPGDKEISVRFQSPVREETSWELYDQTGREVMKGSIDPGNDLVVIDTKEIPSGLYFINLFARENERKVARVIIAH